MLKTKSVTSGVCAGLCLVSLLGQNLALGQTPEAHLQAHPSRALLVVREIGKNLDSGMSAADAVQAHAALLEQVSAEDWRALLSSRLSAHQLRAFDQRAEELKKELALINPQDTETVRELVMNAFAPSVQDLSAQGLTWSGRGQCDAVYAWLAVSGVLVLGGITLATSVDSTIADVGGVVLATAGGAGIGMYLLMKALFPWGGC